MLTAKDVGAAYAKAGNSHPDVQRDGLQAQIDALRAAIVSRNGLLEAISEQIRLGFEGLQQQGTINWHVVFDKEINQQLKAIAERLSALEKQGSDILGRAHVIASHTEMANMFAVVNQRLSAIEQQLQHKQKPKRRKR